MQAVVCGLSAVSMWSQLFPQLLFCGVQRCRRRELATCEQGEGKGGSFQVPPSSFGVERASVLNALEALRIEWHARGQPGILV